MEISIRFEPVLHREQVRIMIYSPNVESINKVLRSLKGVRWSQTYRAWHLPLITEVYKLALKKLMPLGKVETIKLNKYLQTHTLEQALKGRDTLEPEAVEPLPQKMDIFQNPNQPKANPTAQNKVFNGISLINVPVLQNMERHLHLKAYSSNTIRTYLNEMAQFLQTIKGHSANEFTVERIKDYLVYCFTGLKLSENTLHSRINALKFYYEQVLRREKFFWELPRPKKRQLLPRFFSQDEIVAIIKHAENLKHKVMLMLCYSTGMRVSEVVALKTYNINSSRMCILIEQAKGKKDRIAPLSPVLLVMLREYYTGYKPNKVGYLFAGQHQGNSYSTRSLQEVLQQAKAKANIIKPGGIHALRHSFATHLLDKGTDICMIQKLLGHNDLKTTLRYLHTTNKDLLKIISPLDDLKL